ncbi:hypothetical protein O3686_08210 [Streptococcus parasanguinis]|uniref:hypothetical protein n=1 Tax=Streptococcus parasanguinis TaxID=1318 RepID=UPI001D063740|nr:hypothetical protein [Streptococcus parasanguinis]MCB6479945.1 hypothetical protein [Streptococcus parasanguinis]MCB6704070.1 hypothetical protein [Streptococcus parasanguinis]MCB6738700.1 hypothetical protein [Streptococcus parasanguinis]MCB7322750.1 hypothetical protein [Streptococcus parasanguinis]MCB7402524.1 hypothetical protein [Streptococcus parasanguinis]
MQEKLTKASFIHKEGLKDVLWMIHRFFRKLEEHMMAMEDSRDEVQIGCAFLQFIEVILFK